MVAEMSHEPVSVPLKVEGVIVGLVTIGTDHTLLEHYTSSDVETYIKELLLSNMVESISLTVDYLGEPYTSGVPEPGDLGHLRLI